MVRKIFNSVRKRDVIENEKINYYFHLINEGNTDKRKFSSSSTESYLADINAREKKNGSIVTINCSA